MNKEQRDFLKLKEKAEELQSKLDESKGVLKVLYSSLEKEFLCMDLKQAKKDLLLMDENIEVMTKKVEEGKRKLLEKYGELLS